MSTRSTGPAGSSLHLLFNPGAGTLDCCRQQLQAGDSLVLLNTAVLLLLEQGWAEDLPQGIRIHAVEADLAAHGLAGLPARPPLERISDLQWAELVISHSHCLSWK